MNMMRVLVAVSLGLGVSASYANVILDRSPATYATATITTALPSTWENQRARQHFADSFSLGSDSIIDGMDIYSIPNFGFVGDPVSIQLWADNSGAPGALITEFSETISLIDLAGAVVGLNRKHVDLRGQWGTDFHHLVGALALFARHRERLPFRDVIGARYDLDATNQALADVAALRVTKAIIEPMGVAPPGG